MCIVSDKIKFCTCTEADTEELAHYWLLHRFNAAKDAFVLGEPRMPVPLQQQNYQQNKKTFARRLNEQDAFDFPVYFKEADKLVIVLNNLPDDSTDRMAFCFTYKKGKWVAAKYDCFELVNHYDEWKLGGFRQLS